MDNPILTEWLTEPGGLASELTALRVAAGHTGQSLADEIGWVQSKVSRLGNGRQLPTAEELRQWAKGCGADNEVDRLVTLLEQASTRHLEWRHRLAGNRGNVQPTYNELFRRSTSITMFENVSVPGILQTADYARAVLSYLLPLHSADPDVEGAIADRMERHQFLYDQRKQFDLLITENVLLGGPASAQVMVVQLDRLLSALDLPNVRFGIIPLRPGVPVVPVSSFSIHDNDAMVEVFHGEFPNLASHEGTVELYRRVAATLWAGAVEGDEARALIVAAANRHRKASR